jgi:hypothetical protein
VQRLTESASVRDRTLWEAVVDFLSEQGSCTRERLLERFGDADRARLGREQRPELDRGARGCAGRSLGNGIGVLRAPIAASHQREQPDEDDFCHVPLRCGNLPGRLWHGPLPLGEPRPSERRMIRALHFIAQVCRARFTSN